MVILARKYICFRPLYFKDREIKQIILFNEKEKYIIPHGWIEDESTGDVKEMEFKELTVKRKVDFSLKKSYLANFENYEGDKVLTLFIYIPSFQKKDIENQKFTQDIYVYNVLNFPFNGKDITVKLFDQIKKTDLGQKIEELKKELELINIKIDSYTLEKLLENYNVEKK